MNMSDVDRHYCSLIESRLRDAISNRFKPKKGVDRFYLIDSYMVKTRGHTPKAAVVLTCCNKDNKKQLQKIARLQWKFDARQPELSKYPVIVHLGEAARRISDGDDLADDHEIYAYVPDNTPTLSGIVADVEGGSGGHRHKFTIGGTVLINGVPYLLTAGHPFQSQSSSDWEHDDDQVGDESSEEYDSDETDSDSESLYAIFNSDDDSQIASGLPTEVTQPEENVNWPSLSNEPDQSTKISLGSCSIPSNLHSTWFSPTSRELDHDWALIRLRQEHMQWAANLFAIPGQRFPKEVTSYKKLEELETKSSEVWVNAGVSGLRKGWLAGGTAFLDFGNASFEARKIVLQSPLLPGDSGSWVISNDHQVCGHIVAAKPSSPWAYMIPFDTIMKDIQLAMGTEDVRLPSTAAAMVSLIGQASRPVISTCDQGVQTENREDRKRPWNPRLEPSLGLLSSYDGSRKRSNKSSVATVASGSTLAYDDEEWPHALYENPEVATPFETGETGDILTTSGPSGSVSSHQAKEISHQSRQRQDDAMVTTMFSGSFGKSYSENPKNEQEALIRTIQGPYYELPSFEEGLKRVEMDYFRAKEQDGWEPVQIDNPDPGASASQRSNQTPPCDTLHVGNIPMDASEKELKDIFSKQLGYKRLVFRARRHGPECVVKFDHVSFATKALHKLQGTELNNSVNGGLRLRYSTSPLRVRPFKPPVQDLHPHVHDPFFVGPLPVIPTPTAISRPGTFSTGAFQVNGKAKDSGIFDAIPSFATNEFHTEYVKDSSTITEGQIPSRKRGQTGQVR